MDARHARQHLAELRATGGWLRSSAPDGPRYRLWLGDLVEFTRVVFGLDSAEMRSVRAALDDERLGRIGAAAGADATARAIARLDRLLAVIESFALPDPDRPAPTETRDGASGPTA